MDLRQTTKILVIGLLLLASAALPLGAATRQCEALQQWALDNQARLPHDYAGLSALPMEQRRAFYGVLTAEEKATYWQQRVAAYLDAHPELSAAQAEAIQVVAAALTPAVFGWQKAGEKPLAAVEQEARAVLGEKLVHEVFYALGPADPNAKGEVAGSGAAAGAELCTCLTPADCGLGGPYRCAGMPPCQPIVGCGMAWSELCTRMCKYVGP